MNTQSLTVNPDRADAYKLTFGRVIRSEWVKFRTLKVNLFLIVGTAIMLVFFGVVAALATTGSVAPPSGGPPMMHRGGPVDIVMSGANFAVLLMSVLGVLLGAREYSSGLVRVTLAAVPSRLPVLWARILVFAAVTLPALILACVIDFAAGTAVLSHAHVASATWADPGVTRAVFGSAVNLVGIGIMGVALGFILRSVAGGLATLIGGILILPTIIGVLLPDSMSAILKFFPSNAGSSFTSVQHIPDLLYPTAGAVVYFGWIVFSVVLAAVLLKRRDV